MKLALALVLALAGLTALTLWRAARHEARAEAAYPPPGRFLDVRGTRVHVVEMGSGPDLVLIHGASGSTRDMTFTLAPILAERYRVIVFDRPGLGYTDRLPQGPASIADQAHLLADAAALLGAARPIVLGHSYGGAVALAWAVHRADDLSALVPVSSPSHPWSTPLDPLYRVTSSWLGSRLVVPLITAFVPDAVVARTVAEVFAPQEPPAGYAAYFGPGLSLRRKTLRANADQRAGLLAEITTLQPHYGAIAVPTEIVHGTADTTVGLSIHAEKLVRQIPGAALTRLPGVGHMAQHVAAGAISDAVDRAHARAGLR